MPAVTSRYARAFADVVLDKHLPPDQVRHELQSLVEVVASNSDLRRVWESPALPAEQKRKVLDALVARSGTSRQVRNFLAVLIDHERIALLPQVVRQFEEELDRRLGFAQAEIVSARELRAEEKHVLERRVEQMLGKKVRARYSRDPDLIGGAVIKVGSTIYDGSVLGQLNNLREQLSAD